MHRFLPFMAALAALILPFSTTSAAAGTGPVPVTDTGESSARALHERAKTISKLEKKYGRRLEACNRGETAACAEANRISGEIALLRAER